MMPIPEEALEALRNGNRVELQHPDLGREGYNGSMILEPDHGDTYQCQPDVTVLGGEA